MRCLERQRYCRKKYPSILNYKIFYFFKICYFYYIYINYIGTYVSEKLIREEKCGGAWNGGIQPKAMKQQKRRRLYDYDRVAYMGASNASGRCSTELSAS
jgi:hypothetical protein